MIKSFADPALESFFLAGPSGATTRIPVSVQAALKRRLAMMVVARAIDDLRSPPGNRLELLKGDLDGWHSIRVNDQWRLVFQWTEGGAVAVRLMDYH